MFFDLISNIGFKNEVIFLDNLVFVDNDFFDFSGKFFNGYNLLFDNLNFNDFLLDDWDFNGFFFNAFDNAVNFNDNWNVVN